MTARKVTGKVKVTVGNFGSPESKTVILDKNSSVEDAFEAGGFEVLDDEKVISLTGKSVSLDAKVKSNETYLIHTAYKNGG